MRVRLTLLLLLPTLACGSADKPVTAPDGAPPDGRAADASPSDSPAADTRAADTPPPLQCPGSAIGQPVTPMPGPSQPGIMLRLRPVDLSTAVDPLRLEVALETRMITDEQRAAIEAALTLRTWPEDTPVAHTLEYRAPTATTDGAFVIRPGAPLAGRWYLLGVTRIPPGFVPSLDRFHAFGATGYGARFRIDSRPLLWEVMACASEAGLTKLELNFSETVVIPSPPPVTITQTPDPGCNVVATAGVISMTCARLDPTRPVRVTLGRGVRAATGSAEVAPTSLEVTFACISPVAACRRRYLEPASGP